MVAAAVTALAAVVAVIMGVVGSLVGRRWRFRVMRLAHALDRPQVYSDCFWPLETTAKTWQRGLAIILRKIMHTNYRIQNPKHYYGVTLVVTYLG